MYKNDLIRKINSKVNSKIYDFSTWEANNCNAMHILPNISRSKGNQTVKFGQLIEYKM